MSTPAQPTTRDDLSILKHFFQRVEESFGDDLALMGKNAEDYISGGSVKKATASFTRIVERLRELEAESELSEAEMLIRQRMIPDYKDPIE